MKKGRHEAVELLQKRLERPNEIADFFQQYLQRFLRATGQPFKLVLQAAQVVPLQDELVLKMLGQDQIAGCSDVCNDLFQAAFTGFDLLLVEFQFFDPTCRWLAFSMVICIWHGASFLEDGRPRNRGYTVNAVKILAKEIRP